MKDRARLLQWTALALAAAVAAAYVHYWEIDYNSDYAMIGLHAKQLLEKGGVPLFLFSVNYMGMLLEGYGVALMFRLFGISPVSLNVFNALLFVGLVGVFGLGIRQATNRLQAGVAALFVAVASPAFYGLVLRTQPNYTETFLLGTLLFYLYGRLLRARTEREHRWLALGLGCVAGFGIYVYAQMLFFIAAITLHAGLLDLRRLRREGRSLPRSLFFPFAPSLPPVLRWPLVLFFSVNLVHLLVAAGMFFLSASVRPRLPAGVGADPIASLSLSLKLLAVGNAVRVLCWACARARTLPASLGLGFVGFLVGLSPKLAGLIVLHVPFAARTGMSGDWSDVRSRLAIVGQAFLRFGNLHETSVLAVLAGTALLVALGYLLWETGHKAARLLRGEEGLHQTLSLYPFLLGSMILGFVLSNNATDASRTRYVAALVLVLAAALGALADRLRASRSAGARGVALALVLVVLAQNGASVTEVVWNTQQARTRGEIVVHQRIADWLREKGALRGIADYWYAYSVVFLTHEEVILEPLRDAYIPGYGDRLGESAKLVLIDHPTRLPEAVDGEYQLLGQRYRRIEERSFGPVTAVILEKLSKTPAVPPARASQRNRLLAD